MAGLASRALGIRKEETWDYPHAVAEIDRLRTLKRGWDGHGAGEISFEARTNALDFVRRVWKDLGDVVAAPTVAPVDGGVALEWTITTSLGDRELEIVFADVGNEYSVRYVGRPSLELEGEDESVPFLLSLVTKYGR